MVEAIDKTGADASVIVVPPAFGKRAVIEAIDTQFGPLGVITEEIPMQDNAYACAYNLDKGAPRPGWSAQTDRGHHQPP